MVILFARLCCVLGLKYPVQNTFVEVDLKLGDVAPSTVLSKFMENGEWDFHHVEGLKHNSLFDKRAEEIEIRILSNSIFYFTI